MLWHRLKLYVKLIFSEKQEYWCQQFCAWVFNKQGVYIYMYVSACACKWAWYAYF